MGARRDEEGFTLIELVVALSVLAVAIAATATVFYAGIRTGSTDTHRVNGVALATKQTDQLRSVAYDDLGLITGTSPANDAACDTGDPVVVVANPAVAASDPPLTIANIAYGVARCVQWVADSSGLGQYKRTTVVVTWSDDTGAHAVRQDSIAYPGGLGPAGSTTTTTAAACVGSPLAATNLNAASASPLAAHLTWTTPNGSPLPIDSWIVEYSADGFATTNTATDDLVASDPNGSNAFLVGGLAPNTSYAFRVIGVGPAACRLQSPAAQASLGTGTGASVAGCVALLVSISPSVVQRDAGAPTVPAQSVAVTVNTNGHCSALMASYAPSADTTGSVSLSQSGPVWSGAIPAAGATDAWDLGAHAITITQAGVTVASGDLCVVNAGVTAC
jgi:prepilin-type N-terminal cleavage/methylation domain-containing protein